MAARPDKIWFFNLQKDPLEVHNLAPLFNVSTKSDLRRLIEATDGNSGDARMLGKVFAMLEGMNFEQSEPLWPSLVEIPVLIDKTSNSQECQGDEYIYWAN